MTDEVYRAPRVQRLLDAINLKEPDRVPNFEFFVMGRQLDHLFGARVESILEELASLNPACKRTEESDRSLTSWALPPHYGREFAEKCGMDVLSLPVTWFPPVREAKPGSVAHDQNGIVHERWDLHKLGPAPDVNVVFKRVDAYLQALKGTGIGLGLHCRSVFCNTYETLGLENLMYKLYDDVPLVEEVMDLFLAYSFEVAKEVAARPIDVFFLDDDLACNSGLLASRRMIEELWVPRTRAMLEPIHRQGIPVVMHCCGNLKEVIPLAIELGVKGIHPVQPTCNDIYRLKLLYGKQMCFFGNMDLAGVLVFGTPQEVAADTKKHIDALAPGGGYVVGSSHTITNDVPPENFTAMIETAWSYRY